LNLVQLCAFLEMTTSCNCVQSNDVELASSQY
jgi:hypothetical protein